MSEEKTFTMGEVSTLVNALVSALRVEMETAGKVVIKDSGTRKGEVLVEVTAHVGAGKALSAASYEAEREYDRLHEKYSQKPAEPVSTAIDSPDYRPSFASGK